MKINQLTNVTDPSTSRAPLKIPVMEAVPQDVSDNNEYVDDGLSSQAAARHKRELKILQTSNPVLYHKITSRR